jgi:hypothetical protein
MHSKLTSRKFWISVAAFLASFGTGIAGLALGNQSVAIAGSVCVVISSAIYAACEAYVDKAAIASKPELTIVNEDNLEN